MTIAEGTRLGRYEIRSLPGAGGMGEVYLAKRASKSFGRCALKQPPKMLAFHLIMPPLRQQ